MTDQMNGMMMATTIGEAETSLKGKQKTWSSRKTLVIAMAKLGWVDSST